MIRSAHRRAAIAVVVAVIVAACAGQAPQASPTATPDPDAIAVVATTTVFADMVAQVGGTRVRVTSLVPRGGEVHTFDPSPSDIQAIARARLIVRNGLGLDDWLEGIVRDAGAEAPSIALGENLPGATYVTSTDGAVNPHLWLNVAYASRYVARIADALVAADPGQAALFRQRASDYQARLAALDARIREQLAAIPEARRVVVSFHDAFPYFGAAYGITIVGSIVAAPGQDPSAGQIAALVDRIRASGATVILAEAQFNDALAHAIAGETGATVVTDLYDGTLGDPPVDSYLGMMTWDADRIAEAMTGG